ncbi:hypothetical protein PIB30_099045 [Stylosanthes scabra]|uniref:Uncharacterized protein n=1 Tax=Stylosanthes scabra TaxID=79078 RepID=A0ABU6YX28_9FABA|nr:hypothetical protein [Stylosanthes scabra]
MFAADTTSCFEAEFKCYANPSHAGLYRWGHDREEVAALVVLLGGLDGAHTLADGQTQVGGGNHAHIPTLLHFLPHFLLLLEALGDPHLHRLAAGVGLHTCFLAQLVNCARKSQLPLFLDSLCHSDHLIGYDIFCTGLHPSLCSGLEWL